MAASDASGRFRIVHDRIAICDEDWEPLLLFDSAAHRSLMTTPEMVERTVKPGSAGKFFRSRARPGSPGDCVRPVDTGESAKPISF